MKKFILIVCKPALLMCLLCFTVLGCPCTLSPADFPESFTTRCTLKNTSNQEIHMFLEREETGFDPSNKVEGSKSRTVVWEQYWSKIDDKDEITVYAGRDGNVLDTKIIPISANGDRLFTVTWDGFGLY